MDKTETLRRCDIFAAFTDVGLRIIASIGRERRLAEGSEIFVQGEAAESMYLLESGQVGIFASGEDGVEKLLATLEPVTAFGELALLGSGARLVTVKALRDVVLVELRRADFARLQRKKPQACLKLMMAITARLGDRLADSREAWGEALAPRSTPAV